MIFGINALSLRPEGTGESDHYLRELVAHLARVDSANEYRLFVSPAGANLPSSLGLNFRPVVLPAAPSGPVGRFLAEQVWLPLAARRAGVGALLCPDGSVPSSLSPPLVMIVQSLLSSHPELWASSGGAAHRWRARLREGRCRARRRGAARRAAAILAASEPARWEAARLGGVEPARIVVARHGVSSQFRPVEAPERTARLLEQHDVRTPFILVVGMLSPYKNLDRVIEGLAQVRRSSHRLPMLVLVGEDRFGCRSGLERLAETLDLREHVRFLGSLPQNDLPVLYTAATASLSLSSGEASGMPIIEAMACGCPVICARRSAFPEIAGDAALFVDPDRPQEVAEAIWRLTTLPNIRDAWVERSLERARQFDWHETARIARDLLTAVAQGRPLPQMPITRRETPGEALSGSAGITTETRSGGGAERRGPGPGGGDEG